MTKNASSFHYLMFGIESFPIESNTEVLWKEPFDARDLAHQCSLRIQNFFLHQKYIGCIKCMLYYLLKDTRQLLVIIQSKFVLNAEFLDEFDALLPQLAFVEIVQGRLVQSLFSSSLRLPIVRIISVFEYLNHLSRESKSRRGQGGGEVYFGKMPTGSTTSSSHFITSA